jgi:hypothetical protein
MISFRARRRQVVRQARADQIRREIREQIDLLNRCDAGDPEAIRQAEENAYVLMAACQEPAEDDYPEPRPRRYFVGAEAEADEEDWLLSEPDAPPAHALRDSESERAYRRRRGRPDLDARRAALLLAEGYWDANRPLPGAVREALCALSLAPRELRRMLFGIWERGGLARRGDRWARIRRPRQMARFWAVDLRELPIGWPADHGHGLEVCPLRGPPAGTQRIVSRPEALLTCP